MVYLSYAWNRVYASKTKGPFRPRASMRVDASNQTNVKDRKQSHRARRRASINLNKSNERCQFNLYIGYWTSNNNKWPKCSCRYQTPSPDSSPVLMTSLTMQWRNWNWRNIDSWMNMDTLLASRPRRRVLARVNARGLNGPLSHVYTRVTCCPNEQHVAVNI